MVSEQRSYASNLVVRYVQYGVLRYGTGIEKITWITSPSNKVPTDEFRSSPFLPTRSGDITMPYRRLKDSISSHYGRASEAR